MILKNIFLEKSTTYEIPKKKFTFQMHFIFWFSKISYFFWTIGFPWIVSDLGTAVLCYLLMSSTTGIIIALVFQLAHIVEASKFTKSFDGEMSHSWRNSNYLKLLIFKPIAKYYASISVALIIK